MYTLLNIIPQIQHLDCVENEHFFIENERGGKKVQGIYDMRVWYVSADKKRECVLK